MMENVIIVGSGPAGMTAGIYLARAGLSPLVLEGMESGGQLMTTNHVDNFPGFGTVTGPEIIKSIRSQAERLGVRFQMDEVTNLERKGEAIELAGMIGNYSARAVLVATGASIEKTGLPGEAQYWGRGVSGCLTCDAAFYKGKRVVVVGTGPAAQAAKNYLEKVGDIVVGVVAPAEAGSFSGDGAKLTKVGEIETDGAFIVTRRIPQTKFLKGVELDASGTIVTHERVFTSVPGVFAAGDCAQPKFRQAIIAAGDGAYAALAIAAYLK